MPTGSVKRIGFVDYRLDNFHANTILRLLRGPLADRGYLIAGATATDRAAGKEWCTHHEIPWFNTVDELDPHVDYFLVLAPSNPELHLELCAQVLPHGKTTFVDKTFAPDLGTARKIFDLADQHCVSLQTSSALRYTAVQKIVQALDPPVECLSVWAGGTSFDEYGIHPIELVVSCLGSEALDLLRVGSGTHFQLIIRFARERTAIIDFTAGENVPYAAAITTRNGTQFVPIDLTDLFRDSTAGILDFFDADAALVEPPESLAVRNILDRASVVTDDGRFHTLAMSEIPRPHTAAMRRRQSVSANP